MRAAHRAALNDFDLKLLNVARFFVLGAIPPNEHFITQRLIQSEQQRFNDIVQGMQESISPSSIQ